MPWSLVAGSVEALDASENNPTGEADEPEDEDCVCVCVCGLFTSCAAGSKAYLLDKPV